MADIKAELNQLSAGLSKKLSHSKQFNGRMRRSKKRKATDDETVKPPVNFGTIGGAYTS